jgi:predicted cupin superfamily sugar epimerase
MRTLGVSMEFSPESHTAADVVRLLQLEPLPQEGGFFRRTAESPSFIDSPWGRRRAWSSIYALFTADGLSAMHRLRQDEVWCFHAGDPLEALRLPPDGPGERVVLGLDPDKGHRSQDIVLARTWQGARVVPGGRWSLVSCVVAPEFIWEDFEMSPAEPLVRAYPEFEGLIRALTPSR